MNDLHEVSGENADCEIDARGLACPLPVLKAQKALAKFKTGALLRVLADDAMARIDFPHFCRQAGHELVSTSEAPDGAFVFLIRAGKED